MLAEVAANGAGSDQLYRRFHLADEGHWGLSTSTV
jgi:hypothetical protein